MSIAGKWKVKKIMHFEEDEPKLITIDEFNAIPEEQRDEEQAQMASSVLDITEDGKLTMMIPIPAEAIEEARSYNMDVIVLDHHTKDEILPNFNLYLHPQYSAKFFSNSGIFGP